MPVPGGKPATDDIAAGKPPKTQRHLRIVAPQLLARRRIVSRDEVPRLDIVEPVANHDGGGFLPAIGGQVRVPDKTQFAHRIDVDLVMLAIMVLRPAAAGREPRCVRLRHGLRGQRQGGRESAPDTDLHPSDAPGMSEASAQNPCTCPTHLNGIRTHARGWSDPLCRSNRIRSERPASSWLEPMPIR